MKKHTTQRSTQRTTVQRIQGLRSSDHSFDDPVVRQAYAEFLLKFRKGLRERGVIPRRIFHAQFMVDDQSTI
jgi:hypothetical protein